MKALRRSIKGEKDKPQIAIAPKSAVAIVPPKKVIRALYDYEARSSQELSFSRGDFFHVIGRENDTEWYEACNPALPDARGLVPVAFFQALGRTERDSQQSDGMTKAEHDSGYSENGGSGGGMSAMTSPSNPATQSQRDSKNGGKPGMVYGIVMYDFQAERADELEAKAGEAIIVIAQSNPEWFVAKPIGRLGGPGLIPVSFVEIRDMSSNTAVPNQSDAIKKAGIPRVEEWKKMAADYKNSSITLGKFEASGMTPRPSLEQSMDRMSLQNQGGRMSTQNGGYQQGQQPQQQPQMYQQQRGPSGAGQPGGQFGSPGSDLPGPVSASIPRYCFAEDKYWFVIDTIMDDGRHWELSRYYEDFYDFQIALLTEFPAEAGNTGTQKRTLPYMPGPVNYVTDAITEGRLHNLDAYVKNLLAQPAYIAKCTLVRQFFAPREGDYEIGPENEGDYRLSGGSHPSSTDTPAGPDSRQGSKNNLNGGGYGNMGPPRQMGSNGPMGGMPGQSPYMSQPSQSSLNAGMNQGASAMKVKLCYNDEVVAIRVATDIPFDQLYEKVRERLKIPPGSQINVSYKDELTGDRPPLMNNADLDYALSKNEKLLLYVDLV